MSKYSQVAPSVGARVEIPGGAVLFEIAEKEAERVKNEQETATHIDIVFNGYYDVMDDELKFIYYCPKCGQRYVTGREAEWTCDSDGAQLHPLTVEHWDCNGEFEYEEEYHEYVRRNL